MPQLTDNVYLGPNATGMPANAGVGVGATNAGIGPTGRIYVYDIVPLTLQANNLATSQSPGTATITLTAGTGITTSTISGQTVLNTDVPRILTFASGGNDTGITFNVVGYDQYGVPMTENVTGATGATASGKKAWSSILSITPSAAVASTLTVGTGDVFGFPVLIKDRTYVSSIQWNNTLAKDTGTLVTGVATAATKTTGDVRGTYAPSTGASDGVKRLVVSVLLSNAQVGATATTSAILGVVQA